MNSYFALERFAHEQGRILQRDRRRREREVRVRSVIYLHKHSIARTPERREPIRKSPG